MKQIIINTLKVLVPIFLGVIIMCWIYKDFDFSHFFEVLNSDVRWEWMILSLPFGVTAQVARGLRWEQTLKPIGEHPRRVTSIHSIFVSYAANIVLPRVGEISRCGILKKYDGVSFSKSIGTVVMERVIDSLCVLLITLTTIAMQMGVFATFFNKTGTDLNSITAKFTGTGTIIIAISALAVVVLLLILAHSMSIFTKIKGVLAHMMEGILSLRQVKNKWLFAFYTAAIWGSYMAHFYLTFNCFEFTENLGFLAGLVMFAVGSIAVIVPTPNGAGPWHFAVITMMTLYGVAEADASVFALLVHTIQSLLIVLLGIYALVVLSFTKKKITLK